MKKTYNTPIIMNIIAKKQGGLKMKQKYFHFTIVAPQHNGYRTKQANILSNEYATTDTKSQWWRVGGNLEDKVRAWAGQCDTLYIVKAATIDEG